MKSLFVLIFFSILIEGYSQTETPEQTLVKMEDKRIKAILARDSMTLISLYDERYRGVLASGVPVTRAGVIEYQLASNPHLNISIEQVEATVHGDVGIVTGVQMNRSKAGTLLGHSKFIRVYKKATNTWRIIYSQGTLVHESD